uniref:Plant disease resistance polyprotein-like n=1 Tax=Oryza sativa subsp. japonica TaxID=39947 RepID=Q67TR0_ORYSJ|nr:plant disease resistance polyprotein-like [Oryza sativa Japonica Group]BAD38461.1 plant disease resistance polyprotein-like [Oryza sativa Japonica Group]
MGAEGAAHARTWPTWPGEGGDEGAAAVSGAAARRDRREEGDGTDRWAPPVGDPERGGGGRPGLPDWSGWASACGRPSREEGEEKGNGPTAHLTKRRKKKGKKKKKRKKDFSLELKYCLLNFNWLKIISRALKIPLKILLMNFDM